MKKFYSLISVVLFGTLTTFGQVGSRPAHKNNATPSTDRKLPSLHSSARQANPKNHTATAIWSDDFSNASNWTIASGTAGSDNWVIGTGVPSGAYAIPGITSTTAANGFAMYDSDLMCGGDQIGNLTNATPINCTGHPAVRITFEEYYRKYIDSTYLYVSNDNVNWTLFPVNAGLAQNAFTPTNPTVVSVNISSVAGNQATVYVRFTFYSPASLGTGAGCAYAWMVDDISVEDVPADDVAMAPGFPSQYTMIPLSQAQPLDLSAKVANAGGSTETNVGFSASVYLYQSGAWSQVATGLFSSTAASLNSGDTTAALSAGSFTLTDTGVYAFQYITFMDNADADGNNDTLTTFIVVTDTIYGRDEAAITGTIDNSLGFNANTGNLGNLYDVYTNTIVKSISFFLSGPTAGDQVTASMYSITGGLPDANLGTSDPYTITADDATNGVFLTLPLPTPVAVTAGQQFYIGADQLGQNNLTIGFNLNVYTAGTAFFQVAGGGWNSIDVAGFLGTFLCRANLDLDNKVSETAFSKGISMFPNPSNGKLYIHNNGQKENMTVTVFNNVGQTVYTGVFSQMANAVVDLTKQSAGVYSVQIKTDKDIATKSVVISNK